MTIAIVVAVSENGVIGRNGDLPWQRLPEDFRRFKLLTLGHTVIMGRKTAESIIKRLGGPLPDRRNVALTKNHTWSHAGFEVVHSWDDVAHMSMEETIAFEGHGELFIIGGAELYELALPHADRLYVTHVRCECEGDAFFPNIDPAVWTMVKGEEFLPDGKNSHRMTFCLYEQKSQFVDLTHARTDDQRSVMGQIAEDGVCPFCPEHLAAYHHNPVIRETEHLVLTESQWPYKCTTHHFLIIPKKHAETIGALPAQVFVELHEITAWVEQTYQLQGGALCIRFGNTSFSGGSVNHLHMHIIVPDASQEPVRFKIGR